MVDLSNYPHPTYESNKAAAGVVACLIGVSLIAWIIQSIQVRFVPRRLCILLLISHLTIFVEMILRASLSNTTRNSRAAFTATTVLLAVGQRLIFMANYSFLLEVRGNQSWLSRSIFIGTLVGVIGSAVLMAPAGTLSYNSDTIDTSFRLRQVSAAIVLCMTIVFYPIWYVTKTAKEMTRKAVILMMISSVLCVIVAIFIVVTSVPDYYVGASKEEFWFYVFQLTPIVLAQLTWTILHPKRSLVPSNYQPRPIETNQI